MTAPWPGRWLPTGTAPIAHRHQGLAPSQHLGCPPEAVAAPRHSKPQPQATQAHTGGFSTPFPTFPNASIKGSGQQSPPPPRAARVPLASPRPGRAPRNPSTFPRAELSRVLGEAAALCPPPGSQPSPPVKAPQHLAEPPTSCAWLGMEGHPTQPTSPSHLLPWLGEGTGLAAAPAWARGIRALFTAEIRVLFKEHANQSEQTAWALPAAAAAV